MTNKRAIKIIKNKLRHLLRLTREILIDLYLVTRKKTINIRDFIFPNTNNTINSPDIHTNFLLVRILGNDLYPRHGCDQTSTNLKFILENEPQFNNCTKLFVLNRIIDKNKERKLIDILQYHSVDFIRIPFIPDEYAQTGWQTEPFGGIDYFSSKQFNKKVEGEQFRIRVWAMTPKILYAMNLNGARNIALDQGRTTADWTLALDGNCIFTADNFETLKQEAINCKKEPYLIIPFARLKSNNEYGMPIAEHNHKQEEPQIAFHASARERYNENLPYGIMDKAALLKKLGVPGPWTHWGNSFWLKQHCPKTSVDRYAYKISKAQVYRLSSGKHGLKKGAGQPHRYHGRMRSISTTIEYLNNTYGSENIEYGKHIFFNSNKEQNAK